MKTWLKGLVLLLLVSLMIPPASVASDLPEDHRFYEEITYLMDKGIVEGTIQPDRIVSRAETAVMIGRLKEWDGTQRPTPFRDVPERLFASGYIAEAVDKGLMEGCPGGMFKPDAPIDRGDMAIVMQRVFDLTLMMEPEFNDVSADTEASDAIRAVLLANLMTGYPDGTFRPQEHVTQGEFMASLARGMEPKFKNKAALPKSYLRDKTKTHVMENFGVRIVYTYEKHEIEEGKPPEFMWVLEYVTGAPYGHLVEGESYAAYTVGYPPNTGHLKDLAYPVKTGKAYVYEDMGSEGTIIRTITGVGKTVQTPYKTFTNATEVTDDQGNKWYYAEGHGLIKSIDPDGAVMSVLVGIR